MSSAFSGATATVAVGTAVSEVQNWKITPKGDIKDVTSFSSAGWKEGKVCIKSWEGSFETEVYPGDIAGTTALGTFTLGTGQPGGGTGTSKSYVGSVQIAEVPVAVPYDDIIKWTVSFQGSGPLTIS